jgi:YVTN family beta-propeller protein
MFWKVIAAWRRLAPARQAGWTAAALALGWGGLVVTLAASTPAAATASQPAAREDPFAGHRSPYDVATSPDGGWLLAANQTSGTVSLVNIQAGKVTAETATGARPTSVTFAGPARAVVTNTWSGTLSILSVRGGALRKTADVPVGAEPRGVAVTRDGKTAFVALTTADTVAVVDLERAAVRARISVGERPWHLALSPDERWLVVGNSRSRDALVVSTATLQSVRRVKLAGVNLRQVAVSPDGSWAYVAHLFQRGFPTTRDNIERGWVLASRLSRIPLASDEAPKEALALDTRGRAVGDPYGVALSPDGNWLAVSASGTHELLLFRLPLPFVAYGGPGDLIEPELLRDAGAPGARFRRVPLGGRPMGIRFAPDSQQVYVANYLADTVQVVDVAAGAVSRTIDLGHPAQVSPARRGEAIFYDAQRSTNQWFSCSSCHVEGHTEGLLVDTFNDGQYGNGAKKTLSLRRVTETGPWTWHGWQKSLTDAMANSIQTTMHGPAPSPQEALDLVAYLATLDYPRNPNRLPDGQLTPSARRGEQLFKGTASCAGCHAPPYFTSEVTVDVGLGAPGDRYPGYNPPSLLGLYDKAPYLHDGRANTLREALTRFHVPEKLGARRPLNEAELNDLIDYLNSL